MWDEEEGWDGLEEWDGEDEDGWEDGPDGGAGWQVKRRRPHRQACAIGVRGRHMHGPPSRAWSQ